MNRFSISSEQVDGKTVYTVVGSIETEQQFERINADGRTAVTVDLGGVNFISSNGIRAFFKWLGKFPPSCRVTFRAVPYVIARQIGSLQDFLPKDYSVESISVPYVCVDCDTDRDVLFREGVEYRKADQPGGVGVTEPDIVCSQCGKPMEMDVVSSSYFWFLKPNRAAS